MLVLIALDAMPSTPFAELSAEGLVPRLTELREAATVVELTTPASLLPAAAFQTLWTGETLAGHGIHYPFMWDAAGQRVRYVTHFTKPPQLWNRVSEAGGRVLVVDAYEAAAPTSLNGLVVNGWQFTNRSVLRAASAPPGAHREWERRLGQAPGGEEVFGEPNERTLRRLAATLVAGPRRVADLVLAALPETKPDILLAGFPSVHLAGHQLWDPGRVVEGISSSAAQELQRALRAVIVETDAAVGRIADALPVGADVVVFSSLGMTADTSRVDVLPAMLGAILDGVAPGPAAASSAWRIRSRVSTSFRAHVANALPDATVTELAARLELRGVDWSRTRAFPVPSDTVGTIRLNLIGRERDGIVDPADAAALVAEITEGLESFSLDGDVPAVASVEVVADVVGDGPGVGLLPDLVVHWSVRPTRRGEVLSSPQFGVFRRDGVGSGRSGNHNDDAWALVLPGSGHGPAEPKRDVADIAATALARFGLDSAGRTLIEHS